MRTCEALSLFALALTSAASLVSAQSIPPSTGHPTRARPIGASFSASEGPTGTENPLAYDELLALGSVAVGQGPNAGTLVRVRNAGQAPMQLGAPELNGTDPNDFAVVVESSALPLEIESGLPVFAAPFRPMRGAGGTGLVLALEAGEIARLGRLREVALDGFPLPGFGAVTLALRRRELPIAADAKLVVDGREIPGGPRRLVGGLQVWS